MGTEFQNAAHVVFFALFSAALQYRLRNRLLAFFLAMALGIAMEILQWLGPRDASWHDVTGDAAGAASGLLAMDALHAWQRRHWFFGLIFAGAASCIAGIASWPLWVQIDALREARAVWPVLLDPGMRRAPVRVIQRFSAFERTPNGIVIGFADGPRPGIESVGWMGNWSDWSIWSLDIENPTNHAVEITLTVHDGKYDDTDATRFNRAWVLAPQARSVIRIPLVEVATTAAGGRLDLSDIRSYSVVRTGGQADRIIIHRIGLEEPATHARVASQPRTP